MVTFNVHSKTHKVPAYIDSGNSFFNCIAKETYEKIGFNLSQLEESPTPAVSQAGGGATLKILGKVPNTKENGFAFESSKTFFPLKNIFVVEGLHHEFNISYAFLKENHCIVDIKNDYLIFEPPFFKKQKFPMVHPPSTKTILCGALLPNLPPRGRTLRPRESIILPLPASDHGHFFYPRRCTAGGGTATFTEGPPWELAVQGAASNLKHLCITNTSTSDRTLYPSSKIGSVCSALPPVQDSTVTSTNTSLQEDKRAKIHDQVKLDKEYKKLEYKLHELLMVYNDCISWNGEPGKTNLGETEICTGGATPIFVPPSRLSPDVAKIVEKQIKQDQRTLWSLSASKTLRTKNHKYISNRKQQLTTAKQQLSTKQRLSKG